MGEVKRYKCGYNPHQGAIMIEAHYSESDLYRKDSDYARLLDRVAIIERERDELAAEVARLRAVEGAAKHLIYADEKGRITDFMPALRALAEACGRKG